MSATAQLKHSTHPQPVKTTRLGYIRQVLGMIPELEPQQEPPAQSSTPAISMAPPQATQHISQLPKAEPVPALPTETSSSPHQQNKATKADHKHKVPRKVRAALHDDPRQKTKAQRTASRTKEIRERKLKSVMIQYGTISSAQ